MRKAVKVRWANTTPEERSAYAKKMVEAREAKRQIERQTNKIPRDETE